MSQSLTLANIGAVGVIADLEGTVLSDTDRQILSAPALSGLILFARNYESPSQLCELVASVRAIRADLPFFVDQEGGRVQRFREGFSRLPTMLTLGHAYDQNPTATLAHARQLGWLMASELQQCGVDVSFAPVLDVERGLSKVIGNRAFAMDPARVTLLAGAFIDGMADAGMAAVGKHFPGHGAVEADSHHELPVDARSLEQLRYDMRPFVHLISHGKLGGIMPSHVLYPALDPLRTAGFSSRWLDFLRSQLGFGGVIFSDDLSMEGAAAAGGYAERAEQAMAAGCNALVVCNRPQGAMAVLAATAQQLQNGRPLLDLSAWRNHTAVDASQLQSVRSELSAAGLLG
ncbi:beta-N-acetylhexosaminidase [Parathalassolituus penaei]|uniref:Beta-hexosaminidase n=1 Tax=Parathalassolituus penaei TaxID=2997323 RepID=A0A9X3IS95_9GAMM|nr:beta-N-acetylhexosaminidase [Parathalassolituus penaei]MCY0964659.1 beta-N-acetylhexosaminidase [Parathalassolituus penaei]